MRKEELTIYNLNKKTLNAINPNHLWSGSDKRQGFLCKYADCISAKPHGLNNNLKKQQPIPVILGLR